VFEGDMSLLGFEWELESGGERFQVQMNTFV